MAATKQKSPEEIKAILASLDTGGESVVDEADIPADLRAPAPVPVADEENTRLSNPKIRKATSMNVDFRQALSQILEEEDCHPLKELIRMYKLTNEDGSYALPMKERIAIMKELLQYTGPKLKAVDIKKELKGNINITIRQFGKNSPAPRTLEAETL